MLPEDIILNTRRAYDTSATSPTGYGSLGVPEGRYIRPASSPGCVRVRPESCGEPANIFLTAPLFTRFDLTLKKQIPLGGRKTFDIQMDVNNLFNNINFNPVFDPDGGSGAFQTNSPLHGHQPVVRSRRPAGTDRHPRELVSRTRTRRLRAQRQHSQAKERARFAVTSRCVPYPALPLSPCPRFSKNNFAVGPHDRSTLFSAHFVPENDLIRPQVVHCRTTRVCVYAPRVLSRAVDAAADRLLRSQQSASARSSNAQSRRVRRRSRSIHEKSEADLDCVSHRPVGRRDRARVRAPLD